MRKIKNSSKWIEHLTEQVTFWEGEVEEQAISGGPFGMEVANVQLSIAKAKLDALKLLIGARL